MSEAKAMFPFLFAYFCLFIVAATAAVSRRFHVSYDMEVS